jgi:hypothetical protein
MLVSLVLLLWTRCKKENAKGVQRVVEVLMPSADTLATDAMVQSLLWLQWGFMQPAYAPAANQQRPGRTRNWPESYHPWETSQSRAEETLVSQELFGKTKDQQYGSIGPYVSDHRF